MLHPHENKIKKIVIVKSDKILNIVDTTSQNLYPFPSI